MKIIIRSFLLIIWMLLTIVMICTLFGMLFLIPETYVRGESKPAIWMQIGRDLLTSITDNK